MPPWLNAKSQMETTWKGFEAEVKKYVETFGKQVDQQQATFHGAATAQLKAWRDAADKIQSAATELASDRRNDIDAALKRMKSDASEAEANLQKLKRAGEESWGALKAPWQSRVRLLIAPIKLRGMPSSAPLIPDHRRQADRLSLAQRSIRL
jgi:hypothetical protein